ncbi:hypothetical protein BH23ACT2_BH23ACT2_08700 [soil metagenome]
MSWFLLFLLTAIAMVVVATCSAVLMARHRLNRHHRVDVSVPTEAPLTWLADPRLPARLHRRLARVGRTAGVVAEDHRPRGFRARRAEPPPLGRAADDLRAHAVALDRQVARLAILAPGARRAPLAQLTRSVADAETASARLVALSTELRTPRGLPHDDPTLIDVTGRIERLAEAHRQLVALDEDAGLSASPLPAPSAGAGPPGPITSEPGTDNTGLRGTRR